MGEEKSGGGGGGGESSRVQSSFVKVGDRQIFTVDLRPGETTIVSWKKLLKDANKASGGSSSAPEPPALEPRVATGQVAENEEKDAPAPNRFSAVIEKIERLYMGKHSSDEEDLNDFPDDDQYDTEDSFIDDVELDEYFEVDNSAIKHDGFFVNRGKLERINESPVLPNQQTKKRRRKELAKGPGESDDGRVLNKHGRVGTTSDGLLGKSSSSPSQSLPLTSGHFEDLKFQNQLNDSGIPSKNKSADTKMPVDSLSLKVSNGDASISLAEAKDIEKQKTGVFQSKNLNLSNRLKDSGGSSSDASHQKYQEKNAYTQSKSQYGRPMSNVEEPEPSVRVREKNGTHKLPEISDSQSKFSMQTTKTSNIHKRDGSSVKPKSTMLERAIRELEKMVAESRPPAMENQEADASNQAIKRRLPREIKLKLAKVARLAQASHGKISEELLNRLMSILGHLIQLRTLKRNLNVMISMGLSAKREKDDRFQLIKKEVVEMIKVRAPSLESKAFEQQAGASDDFQEYGSEEVAKRKFSVDTALEDKICDLYDLFVDGLDEDAGPQVRKLYAELAQLWPTGLMDNHGIKRAICRAKERRRALYNRHKDQEKMKRKKMSAPRLEETVRVDTTSVVQQQHIRDKLAMESRTHHVLGSANKPVSTTTAVRIPSPSMNGPNLDRLKQEKLKGSSGNFIEEARVSEGALPKKKVKRKAERVGQDLFLPREGTQQADERHKSYNKQGVGLPQNNLQLNAPPKFEQSS